MKIKVFLFISIIILSVSCDFFYFDNPFAAASNDGAGNPVPGEIKEINFSLEYLGTVYKPDHQKMIYCPGDSPISGTNNGFWISQNEVTEELFQVTQCNSAALGYTFINTTGTNFTDLATVIASLNTSGFTDYPRRHFPLTDIIIWCNLLSESTGREPVYKNSSNQIIRNDSLFNINDLVIDNKANGYRLLTVDEWQQAASFIDGYLWTKYDRAAGALKDITDITELARVSNYSVSEWDVKTRASTTIGLYDMSGNSDEVVSYSSDSLLDNGSNMLYVGGRAGDGNNTFFTIGNVRTTTDISNTNIGIRLCVSNW